MLPHDITPEHAIAVQTSLAGEVVLQPLPRSFQRIASAWVEFASPESRTVATAVAVLLHWPELSLEESAKVDAKVDFPYISGLFAFRAGRPILHALESLHHKPNVLLLNAQGIAHVRRLGMASHIGVLTGIPTVGCTRQRPPFSCSEPDTRRGAVTLIQDDSETLGAAVRVCTGVRPIYVSPGHLADVASCVQLALDCCRGQRLPQPLRIARNLVRCKT